MKKVDFELSRRTLMTSIACMPIASSVGVCGQLSTCDAELIALGHQFDRLTRIWDEVARQTNNSYDNFDIIGLIKTLNPIEAAIVELSRSMLK